MKSVLLLLLLLIGNSVFAVDCSKYINYDENKVFSGNVVYVKNYIKCALDEKISNYNKDFQYEEQIPYWSHIEFLLEHFNGKGDLLSKNLDAKISEQKILYELGIIATGKLTYVGPNYSFPSNLAYKWQNYYNEVYNKYSYLKNFNENEITDFINQLQAQINHFNKKEYFANSYYFNTYVIHLLAIAYDAKNYRNKNELIKSIISFYFKNHTDFDIYMMIENISKNM